MTRWSTLLVLAALFGPTAAAAQDSAAARPAPSATLTLAEALQQARQNSPAYRQALNDAGPARWNVRQAYGSLLPTANVSAGLGYTGSGSSSFGGTQFNQSSPSYNSNYAVGVDWQLSGRTLKGPAQAKAMQRAADEGIVNAEAQLRYGITAQYLAVRQATAQVEVARQQVSRNADFLRLAQARHQVGQATLLDVRQAEVTRGTGEVQLLRAVQAENEAKLELMRLMGVVAPVAIEQVALTDTFAVQAPSLELAALLALASEQNPDLRALQARERAAAAGVTAAKSEYLPTLSFSAGWRGFTQQFTNEQLLLDQQFAGAQGTARNCEFQNDIIRRLNAPMPYENGGIVSDCNSFAGLSLDGSTLDPTVRQDVIDRNSVFPFNYQRQPFSATLTVSLPIFTGFGRQLRVAEARAQQQDLEESVRARGLQVRTEVQARHLGLQTAFQAIAVQQTSRDAAREQLQLAQDRYRLGSGTALELSDAQNSVSRAEGDYVNAVYDYHRALAALEAAVGRPLR